MIKVILLGHSENENIHKNKKEIPNRECLQKQNLFP